MIGRATDTPCAEVRGQKVSSTTGRPLTLRVSRKVPAEDGHQRIESESVGGAKYRLGGSSTEYVAFHDGDRNGFRNPLSLETYARLLWTLSAAPH